VNNAGVGATAPLLDSDIEKMDETDAIELQRAMFLIRRLECRINTRL
jgi:hypothetical protein